MSELNKITADQLRRCAVVYVRQSSTTQVEHNRESTARQYQLADRAMALGWRRDQVRVIDSQSRSALEIKGRTCASRTACVRSRALSFRRISENDFTVPKRCRDCGLSPYWNRPMALADFLSPAQFDLAGGRTGCPQGITRPLPPNGESWKHLSSASEGVYLEAGDRHPPHAPCKGYDEDGILIR
jgi:hypothetical protein